MKELLFGVLFFASACVFGQNPLQITMESHRGEEVIVHKHHIFDDREEEKNRFILDAEGEVPESMQPKLPPGFYIVEFHGTGKFRLAIDEGDEPHILQEGYEIKIQGSSGTDLLNNFENTRKRDFEKRVKTVRKQAGQAQRKGDSELAAELSIKEQEAYNEHRDFLIEYAHENMRNSIAFYEVLTRRRSGKNIRLLELGVESVSKKYPDHQLNARSKEMVENLSRTLPGAAAPEFVLPDRQGMEVESSSILGKKATLVEFWASWCAPCRRLNPELNELYEEFSRNGVQFIFISLDKRKERWESAVQKDELQGIHLNDLKGYDSEVAEKFNVTAIPAGFLINGDGTIVERDLKGKKLREELERLSGSD